MEAWKATQKMLDKPGEIVLYDESSSEEDIDSTISVEHKLRMLYSSSDDSESIHPQSTTTLNLSKKSVPIPIVGFTNDSTSTDELIAFDPPQDSCQYPSFYKDIIELELPNKEHLALVKAQNWITDGLQLEIDLNSP